MLFVYFLMVYLSLRLKNVKIVMIYNYSVYLILGYILSYKIIKAEKSITKQNLFYLRLLFELGLE